MLDIGCLCGNLKRQKKPSEVPPGGHIVTGQFYPNLSIWRLVYFRAVAALFYVLLPSQAAITPKLIPCKL